MSTSTLGQEAQPVDQTSPAPFILVSLLMFLGALFLFFTYLLGITFYLFKVNFISTFLSRFSTRFPKRQKRASETIGQRSWLWVTRGACWLDWDGLYEGQNSRSRRNWSRSELWSCPLWGRRGPSSRICRGGWDWGRHPILSGPDWGQTWGQRHILYGGYNSQCALVGTDGHKDCSQSKITLKVLTGPPLPNSRCWRTHRLLKIKEYSETTHRPTPHSLAVPDGQTAYSQSKITLRALSFDYSKTTLRQDQPDSDTENFCFGCDHDNYHCQI